MTSETQFDAWDALRRATTETDYATLAAGAAQFYDDMSELSLFKAAFFRDVDNPYFDPLLAEENYLISASFGNPRALFPLAMGYLHGHFGRVDVPEYRRFRDLALEIGVGGAFADKLVDLLNRFTALPLGERLPENDDQFLQHVFSNPRPPPPVSYLKAACFLTGTYVEKDEAEGLKILLELARLIKTKPGEQQPPAAIQAVLILVRLAYFGFVTYGVEKETKDLLDLIPSAKGVESQALRNSIDADRLRTAIRTMEEDITSSAISKELDGEAVERIFGKDRHDGHYQRIMIKSCLQTVWNHRSAEHAIKVAELLLQKIRDGTTDASHSSLKNALWHVDEMLKLSHYFRGRRMGVLRRLKSRLEVQLLETDDSGLLPVSWTPR